MSKIHPTAIIEDGAKLGADVEIGPNVVVYRHVTIGDGTKVHAGAVLGDLPQDLSFKEADTFVEIGKNCVIREHVTIHRGTKPGTVTKAGDNCFLMANSHLAHNVQLGNNVILANGALLAGYVEVGDRAFISGNAAIHQFCRIGRLAMVSGCAALSKDVPPFCTTWSARRNEIAALNIIGMRRSGMTGDQRMELRRAFKLLYCDGLNVSQALEKMRVEFPSGPAREFWEFIETSKRGICRHDPGIDYTSSE